MRLQQRVWLEEHTNPDSLPAMNSVDPGSGVVAFADYIKGQGAQFKGNALDIGCGKGRNSIYLAGLGFDVYAMDYIKPALQVGEKLAKKNGLSEKIQFIQAEMDHKWKFDDDFFDVAVDCFSSIDIETKEGRDIYRNEMLRTLKPGGYAVVNVCSSDDEWESEAIAARPGEEPNSAYWPNGKFQKNYDEAELRQFYSQFDIVELKKLTKPAVKLNRSGMATNYWLVLQKPK